MCILLACFVRRGACGRVLTLISVRSEEHHQQSWPLLLERDDVVSTSSDLCEGGNGNCGGCSGGRAASRTPISSSGCADERSASQKGDCRRHTQCPTLIVDAQAEYVHGRGADVIRCALSAAAQLAHALPSRYLPHWYPLLQTTEHDGATNEAAGSALLSEHGACDGRHWTAPAPCSSERWRQHDAGLVEARTMAASCVSAGAPRLLVPGGKCTGDGSTECILSETLRLGLAAELPPMYAIRDCRLRYATDRDGCSLRTAYHRLAASGPTLLLILDNAGNRFGGFATAAWQPEPHYFGTGESFLFSAMPALHVHRWTGANAHFQLANSDSIAMGGGGRFGLWLDESFENGSSGACETYGTHASLSRQGEFFRIVCVEFWELVDPASPRDPLPPTEHSAVLAHAITSVGRSPGPCRPRAPGAGTCRSGAT